MSHLPGRPHVVLAALSLLLGCGDDSVTQLDATESANCTVELVTHGALSVSETLTQHTCPLLGHVQENGAVAPPYLGASYTVSVASDAASKVGIASASLVFSSAEAMRQTREDVHARVYFHLSDRRAYESDDDCSADVEVLQCDLLGFVRTRISNVRCERALHFMPSTIAGASPGVDLDALREAQARANAEAAGTVVALERMTMTTQCYHDLRLDQED